MHRTVLARLDIDVPAASHPGPAEVYAALWLGALLVATDELADPFPPEISLE